jgi:hypothetical protein
LEADLNAVVAWANRNNKRWAFTLSHAGAFYTESRSGLAQLDEIDWEAVAATDWQAPEVKEGKQAEFLVRDSFPWELVERIGVSSATVRAQALNVLGAAQQPVVEIRPDWY